MENVSPARNVFKYDLWMTLLDVDQLSKKSYLNLFSSISLNNRLNVLSFNREDYYGEKTEELSESIRNLVYKNIGIKPDGKILLLTNLANFGYVFNSLSIYYCYNSNNELLCCALEVTNTPWLVKRVYVVRPDEKRSDNLFLRNMIEKDFHVSPFKDVYYVYDFEIKNIFEQEKISFVMKNYRRRVPEGINPSASNLKYTWEHKFGGEKVKEVDFEEFKDSEPAFEVRLNIQQDTLWNCFKGNPVMCMTDALRIHWQAYVIMFKKGCEFKITPNNQPAVQLKTLLLSVLVFSMAFVWSLMKKVGVFCYRFTKR
eukprot:maker-scaffold_3-snap-gene-20.32-mRNA-1 protein AED:0.48 eAED:0.49 QI:0/0/0/1/1/1/2/0/312